MEKKTRVPVIAAIAGAGLVFLGCLGAGFVGGLYWINSRSTNKPTQLAKQDQSGKIGATTGQGPATQQEKTSQQGQTALQPSGEIAVFVKVAWIRRMQGVDKFGDSEMTETKALIIALEIRPLDGKTPVKVQPWDVESQPLPAQQARLQDESKNLYPQIRLKAPSKQYIKYDGKEIFHKEMLTANKDQAAITFVTFQRPSPAAKQLTLILPGSNHGGKDDLKLSIPVSTIEEK
jgi:hypothetical protein